MVKAVVVSGGVEELCSLLEDFVKELRRQEHAGREYSGTIEHSVYLQNSLHGPGIPDEIELRFTDDGVEESNSNVVMMEVEHA